MLEAHPRAGIISPCSRRWGERLLLVQEKTKYFWFIHNNAYLIRRQLIEEICDRDSLDYIDFLLMGNNFRGYGIEHELIAKAYVNDWAAAITAEVWAEENEVHLAKRWATIKTAGYAENFENYVAEGRKWMRKSMDLIATGQCNNM